MKLTPLVTIMIPTYNQAKDLKQTVESALAQDYENLEIIISDDRSTDNTSEIAKKIESSDSRVKYFCNEINLGRVGNYKKALYDYANGKYVLNLDGDDLLIDKTFIRMGMELFNKYQNSNLLVACKQYNLKDKIIKIRHNSIYSIEQVSGIDFILNLFNKYEFSHLTTIYNRHEALKIDFYRKNIISSDMESLLRLALLDNVILYNKIVGQWNLTGNNESVNQSFEASIDNFLWIDMINMELVKHTSIIKSFIWRVRMKSIYSYPILLSFNDQKNISRKQLLLLFEHRIFFISLFNLLKIIFRKAFHKLASIKMIF